MRSRSDVVRDVLLVVLAGCGGAFDAISYLDLHAFTANMTANTVLLGLWFGGRHFRDATHCIVAIAAFGAGAFVATLAGEEASDRDPWPRRVLVPFAIEVALLVAFAALWRALPHDTESRFLILLALGAAAMGAQSGITHDVHLSGASTTYMTGTIARTAEKLADSLKGTFRGGFVLNGLTWLVYLAVALGVGTLDARTHDVGAVPWTVAAIVLAIAATGRRLVLAAR